MESGFRFWDETLHFQVRLSTLASLIYIYIHIYEYSVIALVAEGEKCRLRKSWCLPSTLIVLALIAWETFIHKWKSLLHPWVSLFLFLFFDLGKIKLNFWLWRILISMKWKQMVYIYKILQKKSSFFFIYWKKCVRPWRRSHNSFLLAFHMHVRNFLSDVNFYQQQRTKYTRLCPSFEKHSTWVGNRRRCIFDSLWMCVCVGWLNFVGVTRGPVLNESSIIF